MTCGDGDAGFRTLQLSPGLGYAAELAPLANGAIDAYGVVGGGYYRTDGLDAFRRNPACGGAGTGEDGDDVGFPAEAGIGATFLGRWETTLCGKHHGFGDGSGPGFGARRNHAINRQWTLVGSWDGIWVEEAGHNVGIDTQRFTLGVALSF